MRRELIVVFQAVLLVSLFGCASGGGSGSFPQPRPSGSVLAAPRIIRGVAAEDEATGFDEPTGEITVREAFSLAVMGNPALAAYAWERRVKEAAALQDRLFPNPELGVEIENVGGGAPDGAFGTAETTVLLSQLVETGGKRGKRARVSGLEADLAGWDYEAKRLDVLTETAAAFVAVLAAQQRVLLAEEIYRIAEEVRAVVSARVEAGKVSPLEAAKASVECSLSEIRMQRERGALEAARKRLASCWGATSARFGSAAGALDVPDSLPEAGMLDSLLGRNPEVERWRTQIEQRQAALALARAGRYPDLAVGAGVRWFEENGDRMLVFGFSVPLPLFDRNQGAVREAEYLLAKAREEQRSSTVGLRVQLERAVGELRSAHSEAVALEKLVLPVAGEVLESAREGYRQGKFGLREVLDAQASFIDVGYRRIEALVAYHEARAAVERLLGRGLETVHRQESNE